MYLDRVGTFPEKVSCCWKRRRRKWNSITVRYLEWGNRWFCSCKVMPDCKKVSAQAFISKGLYKIAYILFLPIPISEVWRFGKRCIQVEMTLPPSYDSMKQYCSGKLSPRQYTSPLHCGIYTTRSTLAEDRQYAAKFPVWIEIESLSIVHPSIFYGLSWIHVMLSSRAVGLVAQLVEHCTGIAKVRIQIPLRPEFLRSSIITA